jgi:hypothetical protein
VAGIVSGVAVAADGNVFTLKDGSEILIPVNSPRFGTEPTPGDLLMYGESAECGIFRARAALRERPDFADCLGIGAATIDDDDFVLFQDRLRVPKADGFVTRPRYVSGVACLNERGEIVHYGD